MGMGMGTGMGTGMGMGMGMGAQQGHAYRGSISSPPLQATPNYSGMAPMAPQPKAAPTPAPATPNKPAASFDDLWSMSLGSSTTAKPATPGAAGGKSIKDLEKEKAMNGLWGSGGQKPPAMGMGMGMGSGMGMSGGAPPSSSSGFDDLLG
jgi:epsin